MAGRGALVVTGTLEPYRQALAARLVAMNGAGLETVLARLDRLIAKGESPGWLRFLESAYLSRPEVLHALGLSDSLGRARFTLEREGQPFTLEVESVRARSLQDIELIDAARVTPLRRKRRDALWFEHLPEVNAIYFAFNAYPPSPEFYQFSERLLNALEQTGADRLVIDLRDNTGGDFTRFDWLLGGIRDNPRINRRGHLFALIGDKTFSAAMVNAVQLRQRTNALLIGEPTGAKPNSYSENGFFTLPNSGLTISVSRLYYTFMAGDDPPGVPPDVFVTPSLEAYLAGRDPVLETALRYGVR